MNGMEIVLSIIACMVAGLWISRFVESVRLGNVVEEAEMNYVEPEPELHWTPWSDGCVCTGCDWKNLQGHTGCCPRCGSALKPATVRYQYHWANYRENVGAWEVKSAVPDASRQGGFVCEHCGAPNAR